MTRLLLLFFLLLPKLIAAQIPTLVVPIGHVNPVAHLALSPDGKYLLSGDETGLINLWLAATGENIFTQRYERLEEISFSSDAISFWAIGNQTVTRYDLFSQDTIQHVKGKNSGWYNGVNLSDDEQFLFASNQDSFFVWSVAGDTMVTTTKLPSHKRGIFNQEKNYFLTPNPYGAGRDTLFLLDAKSGAQVQAISPAEGESFFISPATFSKDGRRILVRKGRDLLLWSIEEEAFMDSFLLADPEQRVAPVNRLMALSPTGGQILLQTVDELEIVTSGGIDRDVDFGSGTMELWDLASDKKLLTISGATSAVSTAIFSDDGERIISGHSDGSVRIWDRASGALLQSFENRQLQSVTQNEFLADDRILLTKTTDGHFRHWDLNRGAIQRSFSAPADVGYGIQYTADKSMFLSMEGTSLHLWDAEAMTLKKSFSDHKSNVYTYTLSADHSRLMSIDDQGTLYSWNVKSGKIIFTLAVSENPEVFNCSYGCRLQFAEKNGSIFLSDTNGKTQIRSASDGALMAEIPGTTLPSKLAKDTIKRGDQIIIKDTLRVIPFMAHLRPGLTHTLLDESGRYFSRLYNMGESHFGTSMTCLNVWDLIEGQAVPALDTCFNPFKYSLPSEQTNTAFAGNSRFSIYDIPIYDVNKQGFQFNYELKGHHDKLNALSTAANGRFLVSSGKDKMTKLWNMGSQMGESMPETIEKRAFATLFHIDSLDWIVTSPSGLFDASPAAMRQLYYVLSYDNEWEVIDLEQLKTRYYEPGLLPKIFGYSNERLRPVENFEVVKLYPKVEAEIISDSLHIRLRERNGGIGRVSVFINGKEVIEEVNPISRGENAKRDSIIQYDLNQHRNYLFKHPDSTNTVSLRAYNEEGWLKSRSIDLAYQYKPTAKGNLNSTTVTADWVGQLRPKLYVITVGTSEYTGEELDLTYADQDATMMAKAMQSVGAALFTNGDSLEVHCLSTALSTDTSFVGTPIQWQFASKNNIKSTFEKVKSKAKAEDVILVYFSGHGVAKGGTDETQFYYLTQGVSNEGDLNDPATLNAFTISSQEMTDWINDIPALKQVLIIDACNSGQVIENLTGGSKTLNSSQIRALDRMKDRTGMFILSGSASDKLSYEASEYGQGLLTYAILQGMLGVATRKDSRGQDVIDVMKLFQYARDQVPVLANSINGIQTPMMGFPGRGASFDIGILDKEAKANIPIGSKKPVMIRSTFLNEVTFQDDLNLADHLENAFRKKSERGSDADLVFVDVNQYPNAYSLSGLYDRSGKEIKIKVKLFKDQQVLVDLAVEPAETPKELVQSIMWAVEEELWERK